MELKFRAWSKEEKKFVSKGFVLIDGSGQQHWLLKDLKWLIPSKDKALEIMQYTGLKDKNGREIYEGDVLNSGGLGKMVVKFGEWDNGESYEDHDFGCGWYLQSTLDNKVYGIMYIGLNEDPVIGNIYENPTLKEG